MTSPLFTEAGNGVRTPFGIWLPPGARVAAYVHRDGPVSGNDPDVNRRIVRSLNHGLSLCRPNAGDYVICLPGHTENISTANAMSSLVPGTNIVGLGHGDLRPALIWNAANASFLFSAANTRLANFRLFMEGNGAGTPLTVAAPITISAPGCGIEDCLIKFAHSATELATIGITTTAAARDCFFHRNYCYGLGGDVTTFMRLVGADRFIASNNYIVGQTSSTTVGIVQFLTTASTNVWFRYCVFGNTRAASIHAVTGMAGASGVIEDSLFLIRDDATLAGLVTPGNLVGKNNRTVNLYGEQGANTTPISA